MPLLRYPTTEHHQNIHSLPAVSDSWPIHHFPLNPTWSLKLIWIYSDTQKTLKISNSKIYSCWSMSFSWLISKLIDRYTSSRKNIYRLSSMSLSTTNFSGYSRIREKLAECFIQLRTYRLENSRLSKDEYIFFNIHMRNFCSNLR